MMVIDNFVKDPVLLELIEQDTEFWTPGSHWWGGWWSGKPTPSSLRITLIEYIWRYHTPEEYQNRPVVGFEHWTGTYKPGQHEIQDASDVPGVQGHPKFSLIHHMDKDEYLWDHEQRVVTPSIGTVFYPYPNDCEGGYLRIYDTKEVDYSAPYERIAPKRNRLIIFDPSYMHAVEEVTSGERRAIAINIWNVPISDGYMNQMVKVQ